MTKKLTNRPVYAIIDGNGRLYHHTLSLRRLDAIKFHAWNHHYHETDGEVPERSLVLTPGHKSSWARCKRRGDRCVRVNVYLAG